MQVSQAFVEPSGQGLLRFNEPPCEGCRRRTEGRCSGPQSVQSLVPLAEGLSCFDTRRKAELSEDLDRHRLAVPPNFLIVQGLPAAIPMLCHGIPSGVAFRPEVLYGISVDDLLRDDGSIRYASGKDLRAAFKLPPNGRVCLIASVRDTRLESLWARSKRGRVWRHIRRLNFEFVTGMSFSVFECQSRAGQLHNQDRNMLSAEFLADERLPVIPILCEVVEEDLSYALQWLEERPSIEVVAGLAQGWRTDEGFARFLERMKFLKEHVERPLHFLIVGCSSAARIPRLFKELEHVTVATANLVLSGLGGEWWDPAQEEFVSIPEELPRAAALQASFDSFSNFCDGHARRQRSLSQ